MLYTANLYVILVYNFGLRPALSKLEKKKIRKKRF